MRNIDKKWTLFAIATIVSFYGIFYTLLNSTFALKYDQPIDFHFDDMNFYKCVIDSYNLEFSDNISYNEVMDYEKLKKLSILKCNKQEDTLLEDKIFSVKGIELLASLENISLAYNNISNIDLTNNLKLLSLDLSYNNLYNVNLSENEMLQVLNVSGNNFVRDIYAYKGNNVALNSGIILGSDLILNDIKWTIKSDSDILLSDNTVNSNNVGTMVIYGKSNLGYDIINNVNIINITSDKYQIDELNEYIYINDLKNFDIENITCNGDNITLELHVSNSKLYVKYNDDVLKEFELIERTLDA